MKKQHLIGFILLLSSCAYESSLSTTFPKDTFFGSSELETNQSETQSLIPKETKIFTSSDHNDGFLKENLTQALTETSHLFFLEKDDLISYKNRIKSQVKSHENSHKIKLSGFGKRLFFKHANKTQQTSFHLVKFGPSILTFFGAIGIGFAMYNEVFYAISPISAGLIVVNSPFSKELRNAYLEKKKKNFYPYFISFMKENQIEEDKIETFKFLPQRVKDLIIEIFLLKIYQVFLENSSD